MKNTLKGINSRSDDAEEWVGNQEDRLMEIMQLEDQEKK